MSTALSNAALSKEGTVGVDAGATLCKLVRAVAKSPGTRAFETVSFDSRDHDAIRKTLEEWDARAVVATGGGAARIQNLTGAAFTRVPEFEAWATGAPLLAALEGVSLPEAYLVVSLGTGTSILRIAPGGGARIGGSALGGGTLLGLGELLLGARSFAEITELARKGDRRHVDLLVGDIYDGELPLPADLNAASFGKLTSQKPADIAHALVALVGENVALICAQLARAYETERVLYCGSTLEGNPALVEILRDVTRMAGAASHMLELGAYCGAVGALGLAPGGEHR